MHWKAGTFEKKSEKIAKEVEKYIWIQ